MGYEYNYANNILNTFYNMKRLSFLIFGLAALISCQKEAVVCDDVTAKEIAFQVEGDLDFNVETKATAVTSLNTFNVIAENTSTATQVWSISSVTKSGSNYLTAKYWPITDQKYAFYASNAAMTYSQQGATIAVANANTDIVAAFSAYSASNYKQAIGLTFNHIFARVGTFTVSAPSGYTVSNVSAVTMSAPVSGTYNVKNGTWSRGSAVSHTLSNGSNDVYVAPGDVTVTVTYTLTRGEYVKTFTKTATISLVGGKINNITATPSFAAGEEASEITLSVSLNAWGTQNHSVTLS